MVAPVHKIGKTDEMLVCMGPAPGICYTEGGISPTDYTLPPTIDDIFFDPEKGGQLQKPEAPRQAQKQPPAAKETKDPTVGRISPTEKRVAQIITRWARRIAEATLPRVTARQLTTTATRKALPRGGPIKSTASVLLPSPTRPTPTRTSEQPLVVSETRATKPTERTTTDTPPLPRPTATQEPISPKIAQWIHQACMTIPRDPTTQISFPHDALRLCGPYLLLNLSARTDTTGNWAAFVGNRREPARKEMTTRLILDRKMTSAVGRPLENPVVEERLFTLQPLFGSATEWRRFVTLYLHVTNTPREKTGDEQRPSTPLTTPSRISIAKAAEILIRSGRRVYAA